jgi:putative radical SAM enzyme (TIGR03279 family)
MKPAKGGVIETVISGSPADKAAVKAGDVLLSINGQNISDVLDYRFLIACDNPEICLLRENAELKVTLPKTSNENAGIEFEEILFDRVRPCRNKCEFCFVHQLPPNLRKGLYIRDDDFRLSFLNGCYITLTNLSDNDWQKILNYRLSPLYVSVHSTNPDLRCKLLNNKMAGNIISDMQYLIKNGIQLYTQAVICPEINDQDELERTVRDCANLYPGIQALGIVPVGLTKFQKSTRLRLHDANEAGQTIKLLQKLQAEFMEKLNTPFVQIADEFFLRAEAPDFPNEEYYPDYSLLENGIGMCRLFLDEFNDFYEPDSPISPNKIGIITGTAGKNFFDNFILPLLKPAHRQKISIFPVINNFLGSNVTVCGLLSGRDIIAQTPFSECDVWLLPQNSLRENCDIFLDDVSLNDLRKLTDKTVIPVENSAAALVQTIFEL